jgi:preprotein translocase subunit SecA
MAGRGTDILLGGNAEFMAKQECLKKGVAQPLKAVAGEVRPSPTIPTISYFYYQGAEYKVPTAQWHGPCQQLQASSPTPSTMK